MPATGTGVIDLVSSPGAAGVWTLRLDPATDSVGSARLALSTVTDVTGSIAFNEPLALTLAQPYQQGRLTFALTDSGLIRARITQSSIGPLRLSIVDSGGQPWGSVEVDATTDIAVFVAGIFVHGTYQLIVDPLGSAIGSLTVTLSIV